VQLAQFVAELFPKRPLARISPLTSTASAPPAWSAAPSANAFGDVALAHHEVLFLDNGLSVTQPLSAALGRAGLWYPPPCRDSGSWLLPGSWANWADFFKQAGYAPLTPDWPDDPETVEEARAAPHVLAKKTLKQVADHTTEIINALDQKPAVMGHSTGGLLAQMLAGRGLSAATVAIDPGVFRGVLPLPASVLRVVGPLLVNPLTRGRAITLTFDQFKYGWTDALDEDEAKRLYDSYHVAGRGSPWPRWPTPTSTPGPSRRSTRRTPIGARC